ncbi:glycosyltransferase family 4 protein [Candidatus Kuenenbacteria bacterium]|nr:glycosyltransferase family 4 protein [Candidatus Kuenenbacteria bacterium]
MRIGIDCRKFYDIHLNLGAGVERYTYHLVKNLLEADKENDYVLFFYSDISPETIHKVKMNSSRVKIVKLFRSSSKIPLLDSHIRFSWLLKKEKLDLTVFPANVIPLFYNKKSILIVHDMAIYLHPEWFPERQWFSTKFLVPRSIKKAHTIVAISQNTKQDLIKLFKVSEEKIRIIYPGVVVKDTYLPEEIDKVKKKFNIKNNYVLFIGTIEPRKNILNLIKAFSNYIFENEESDVSLVLAGIKGWKFQPIFQVLNNINKRLMNSPIKYVGKVSNRERNILLRNCQAFVFPSYYEGFGFPIIEAMALRAPVITSNNSSLKEIAGDGAYLIEVDDPNDIRRAIAKVLEDKNLRQQLILKGKAQADKFTWETTVNKFRTLLK